MRTLSTLLALLAFTGCGDPEDTAEDSEDTAEDSEDTGEVVDTDCTETPWYADADGDGFGDAGTAVQACEAPADHIADGTDCDDSNADLSPGATELWCNGIDEDCDTLDANINVPSTGITTLKEGLDAAVSGDVVCVAAGTYAVEGLTIALPIQLLSLDGAATTLLDGPGTDRILSLTAGAVGTVVEGFTFTGGASDSGGALLIDGADTVTLRSNTFEANSASAAGGAVAVLNSTGSFIESNAFKSNTANSGGGLFLGNTAASTSVLANTFHLNTAANGNGGGLRVDGALESTIRLNTFTKNNATDRGGGLSDEASDTTLFEQNTVSGNTSAVSGGGAHFWGSTSLVFKGNTVSTNTSDAGGGITLHTAHSASVSDTAFNDNIVNPRSEAAFNWDAITPEGFGAGLLSFACNDLSLTTSTFNGNSGEEGAGAALVDSLRASITDNSFVSNIGTNNGGGLAVDRSATATVKGNTFTTNEAKNGGGIQLWTSEDSIVQLNTFTGNLATLQAGGLSVAGSDSASVLENGFTNNSAENGGGASVSNASSFISADNSFTSNSAVVRGGGLLITDLEASPALSGDVFTDNSSEGNGGGLACVTRAQRDYETTFTAVDMVYTGNTPADVSCNRCSSDACP